MLTSFEPFHGLCNVITLQFVVLYCRAKHSFGTLICKTFFSAAMPQVLIIQLLLCCLPTAPLFYFPIGYPSFMFENFMLLRASFYKELHKVFAINFSLILAQIFFLTFAYEMQVHVYVWRIIIFFPHP